MTRKLTREEKSTRAIARRLNSMAYELAISEYIPDSELIKGRTPALLPTPKYIVLPDSKRASRPRKSEDRA